MKNSLKHYLLSILVFALALFATADPNPRAVDLSADSAGHVNRVWRKLTVQVHHFTKIVNTYVKVVTKAKPADSTITCEVLSYSDSMDHTIDRTGPGDSDALKKVETLFDSLVQASVRLVKKVENDSAFANNKAVKQLSSTMQNIRVGINNYQKDLNESAAKRKEKKQSPENNSEPSKTTN